MTLEQLIELEPHLRAANSWIQRELAEPPHDHSMGTGALVAVATLLDAAPAYFAVVKAAKELSDVIAKHGTSGANYREYAALRSALANVEEG